MNRTRQTIRFIGLTFRDTSIANHANHPDDPHLNDHRNIRDQCLVCAPLSVVQQGHGPKGWDDSNRLDDMVYRVQPTKLTAWVQPNLRSGPDGIVTRSFGSEQPMTRGSGTGGERSGRPRRVGARRPSWPVSSSSPSSWSSPAPWSAPSSRSQSPSASGRGCGR